MQRVLVIGSPGAGKSTFARRLAEAAGLPLVHLDRAYWHPGWIESDKAEWVQRVETMIGEEAWVMDGNYSSTLPRRLERADMVVFLDMPRWRCLWRVIKRVLSDHGRTRQDMTPGCPEHFDWAFLVYVWRFPRDQLPSVLADLEGYRGERVTLKSSPDVERFLEGYRQ